MLPTDVAEQKPELPPTNRPSHPVLHFQLPSRVGGPNHILQSQNILKEEASKGGSFQWNSGKTSKEIACQSILDRHPRFQKRGRRREGTDLGVIETGAGDHRALAWEKSEKAEGWQRNQKWRPFTYTDKALRPNSYQLNQSQRRGNSQSSREKISRTMRNSKREHH